MRSRLVAGDAIFKSNLVLEHMFPEVAGITTQWTADAWSHAQEICNTVTIIPANEHVRQYKWAQLAHLQLRKTIAANLAKNSNFLYRQVGFCAEGEIVTGQMGKLARTGRFNHPSLETAVLHIMFTGTTSLAAASPHLFCPVPLPVIGFACVAIHYSLDVDVPTLDPSNRKAPTLEAKVYGSHYTTYMDSLHVFSSSHPDNCITLQKRLWDKDRVAAGIPLNAVDNYVSFDNEESLEDFVCTMVAVHTTATSSTTIT
ncbi:hypothetical protein JB92DRAFT_3128713 [Gautieria morchelliformis]|nr:hypothetical protein JB92DRAFT_3128713 [Gautieria morchelliformis]